MQPMRLCILSSRWFEQTLKDSQWRNVKQIQPKVKVTKHVYCNFRYRLLANVFSQISHLCCSKFSSWHLITCVFKLSVLLKVLAHIWHVTTLSVWTFWCLAMCPFLNTFPHLSHFISWCHLLLCWFNLDLDRNVFPHSAHAESNMVLTRWSLR